MLLRAEEFEKSSSGIGPERLLPRKLILRRFGKELRLTGIWPERFRAGSEMEMTEGGKCLERIEQVIPLQWHGSGSNSFQFENAAEGLRERSARPSADRECEYEKLLSRSMSKKRKVMVAFARH